MLMMIDNYDSLTYNLVQALGALGADLRVVRNDALTVGELEAMSGAIDHIIISPGPCTPNEAGISMEVIRRFGGRIPILGVCLGHQSLVQAFGGRIIRAPEPVHGKTALIEHAGRGVFRGLSKGFVAARYHSLVAERATLPECLEITATYRELVMGVRHKTLRHLEGVQFHPESFLTVEGPSLLRNFLAYSRREYATRAAGGS
jgi:anthranilate synthase component 2/para-aminobenzoate synthetase component 2